MTAKNTFSAVAPCPCGRATTYELCCGVYHAGIAAPTPESLMRSRYSAYVLGLADYLQATWHPSTRAAELDLSADAGVKWLGLKVDFAIETGEDGNEGEVHFVARYKVGGKAHRLSEHSRFVRENGRWFYVDGDVA
ncbi:YchJ family protein [Deefgea rivuli]|uniref:YchJ family protein n=1 Tax=Deefgea rivuli TaxID=400948 RepID=UPI0004804314|nr:YchJ family metal-binding protein [Deefgea rivuli]